MKHIVPTIFIAFFFAACNNHTSAPAIATENNVPKKDSVVADKDFFPVPDYIGGQLKIIDSLKLPISKTVTINGKSKLSQASDQELNDIAKEFREPDINDPSLKKHYSQTNIADESVPSVTLMFSTTDTTLTIQKMHVYIKPDPDKNDQVTGIYIEKQFTRNDTAYNQQLIWKTDKNVQVTTEKKTKGKTLPVEQIKISWAY
ncbi:MAG: hypothetical protein QM726_04485 [Chitinophagaceae bacterium]